MNTEGAPEQSPPPSGDDTFHIRIEPLVKKADSLRNHIRRELPTHRGLATAAAGVARVAREAQQVSQQLKKPIGLHRLPALFLLLALAGFLVFIYMQFVHVSELRIAVSSRDAIELRQHLDRRVQFVVSTSVGSRESLKKLSDGSVDMAFVQGGVPIPDRESGNPWIVKRIPSEELVLFFIRDGVELGDIRRVLTSSEGQGSHSLCQAFTECWGIADQVSYLHDWRVMTNEDSYTIPADIDAIFAVKDPLNPNLSSVPRRIEESGFKLASPFLGAYGLRLPYLDESTIPASYLDPAASIPAEETLTYSVSTYLVVNPDLSPRQLAAAGRLILQTADQLNAEGFEPSISTTSELLQGLEAGLGVIVYITLAFLALLGLDAFFYRKRFNELNSLISLISLHQSTKDALGGDPWRRSADVQYLRICSDLLGMISVVTGYYTQENKTLMYNRLLDVIHERAASLKINIQLKILHALIDLPSADSGPTLPAALDDPDDTIKLPKPRLDPKS